MLRIVLFFCVGSLFFTNCGSSEFLCGKAEDGWLQCKDNKVRRCHATTDEDAHFHWGSDCAALNLKCVTFGERKAACIDESTSCQSAEFKCENNTAFNCVNGNWAMERCGTAKTCEKEAAQASCRKKDKSTCSGYGDLVDGKCDCDKGYQLDPKDNTKCVSK